MATQFITVSVRLTEAEYTALQSIAKETCHTMSGVLRWLLNRVMKEEKENGLDVEPME